MPYDSASVNRLVRLRGNGRTAFGAGRRLAESVGDALGDACRCERVGADDSEQSKDARKREHCSQLSRNQKRSPAGLIRNGPRRLGDEQRRQVDRVGLVDPFGHALPQLPCQIVHATPLPPVPHSLRSPRLARYDTIGSISAYEPESRSMRRRSPGGRSRCHQACSGKRRAGSRGGVMPPHTGRLDSRLY